MDSNTYLDLSGRTMAKTFHGGKVSPYFLDAVLGERLALNSKIDGIKKALFYGKEKDNVPLNFSDSAHKYEEASNELHAVIGIDTESAELLEHAVAGTLNRKTVTDEGGDLLWYLAALFREHGVTFEEAMESNIAKLKARYPQGFNTHAATHRNEARESAVFQ